MGVLGNILDGNESVPTVISSGSTLNGVLDSNESLRIDGNFEGTIHCKGTLIIGANANVEAEIVAEVAVIGGRVDGDVSANEKIEILSTGEIFGDLTAPVLQIEQGVVLEGSCTINTGGDQDEEAKVTSIKEKLG
ncbi:MAG: polymer-forming cytoskeletal protein [bacterium]